MTKSLTSFKDIPPGSGWIVVQEHPENFEVVVTDFFSSHSELVKFVTANINVPMKVFSVSPMKTTVSVMIDSEAVKRGGGGP